jgi:hypothetical protein
MYKVVYYLNGTSHVGFKWFKTFSEAVNFAGTQEKESVLEIKQYLNDEVEEAESK